MTAETAARIYGVALDEGVANDEASAKARERILEERRSRSRKGEGSWAWHD